MKKCRIQRQSRFQTYNNLTRNSKSPFLNILCESHYDQTSINEKVAIKPYLYSEKFAMGKDICSYDTHTENNQ